MFLGDIISLSTLKQYIADGYISQQQHPTLPLFILNYTHKTQIERKWDEITRRCRGLIYWKRDDSHKVIIAHPFHKFFNIDEQPESTMSHLLAMSAYNKPVFYEKLDGSMGIGWSYNENGVMHHGVATRGSFTSPQAVWATNWYQKNVVEKMPFVTWGGNTPIFEIIYPENRIVVKYNFSGLVVLGLVDLNGQEVCSTKNVKEYASRHNLPCVKHFPHMSLQKAMHENKPNFEGYVMRVGRLRAKVKTVDYVRLHKMITGWNPKNVWQWIKDGKDYTELVAPGMPEHFVTWFNKWVIDLNAQYADCENQAKKLFEDSIHVLDKTVHQAGNPIIRKDFAVEFAKHKEFAPILFKMLDKQDYSDIIWKKIKPSGNEVFLETEPEQFSSPIIGTVIATGGTSTVATVITGIPNIDALDEMSLESSEAETTPQSVLDELEDYMESLDTYEDIESEVL